MTTIQVCRTCLAHDTRMYTIAHTPLQKYYEYITKIPLNTQDGRPSVVCYICYHLLKKCLRFTESAVRADEVLQQICNSGIQITEEQMTMIDKRLLLTFCKTPVTYVNTTSAVSENIQFSSVNYENFEIKTENEQENMAMAPPEFSEDVYLELEVPTYFEIKKEKIEVEDTQQYLHHSSGSDDDVPLQSIRKISRGTSSTASEPEPDAIAEEVSGYCGQGITGAPEHKKYKIEETTQSVQSSSKETKRKGGPVPTKLKVEHTTKSQEIHEAKSSSKEEIKRKYTNHAVVQHGNKEQSGINDYIYFETKIDQTLNPNEAFDDKQCTYCGKRFQYKSVLTRHLRMHTGEKPFPCNYCDKKFTLVNGLTQHVRRIHTGEKPYICKICGKNFLQKSILSRHTSVHTGEKPFTCNYCGKSYAIKLKLKHHIRMHTGERPYACHLCEIRFTEKYLLTRHLRRHL